MKNLTEKQVDRLIRDSEEEIEKLKKKIASINKEKEAYLEFLKDEGKRVETNEFYDGCLPDLGEYEGKHFNHCREVEVKKFNGFDFVTLFHCVVTDTDKKEALFVSEGDDGGIVCTPWGDCYHVGEYPICYFFKKKPTKAVEFERSIYFF